MASLPPDHPVAVVFLDETGRVGVDDQLFGVGCLKVTAIDDFSRQISDLRQLWKTYDEIQWKLLDKSETTPEKRALASDIYELVCDKQTAQFVAIFDDGGRRHLTARYGGPWEAYEQLAAEALDRLIGPEELVVVLADRYTTPAALGFERAVRQRVNSDRARLAVASLVRAKSSSLEGLQVVDLLLGAVGYDFRKAGDVTSIKGQFAARVRDLHGVPSYRPWGRTEPAWFDVESRIRPRGRRGRRGASS